MSRTGLILFALAVWLSFSVRFAGAQTAPRSPLPKVQVAAGGRTFETDDGKPFVPIGVNYYRPGTGWAPQLWKQFDPEATRRDFTRLKELGVNCVRVFLTYGSFFMKPDALEPEGLARFDQLLGIAEEAGIYVHPTGPDHWEGVPPWAATDRIADEGVLRALESFWKLFADRYRASNVIFAFDLRNEPQVAWDTPAMRAKWNRWLKARYGSADKAAHAWGVQSETIRWGSQAPPPATEAPGDRQLLDYQHFREEIADEWTRRQVTAIRSSNAEALVTVGLIQWSVPAILPSVRHYSAFRPQRQAGLVDFMEIHFYPLAAGFFDYRGAEEEERNLAYLESVVREVAATGRPVVLAEFGWYGGGKLTINDGVHPAASEEDQARWCRRAIEVTEGLSTGWLNWGFYDHPEARDVSQLTGLLTAAGQRKAWARQFEALARTLTHKSIAPVQLGPRPELDWDRCITSPKAGRQFLEQYYEAFKGSADPIPARDRQSARRAAVGPGPPD